MFQFFPFTNAHQLNLDWILETMAHLPKTVNNTCPDEQGNINLPTVAGMSSWNGIGADGAGNVDPVEYVSDLDNAAVGLHFYRWENPDTDNNPYGAAENTGYMTGSGGGMCISYVTASGYAVQIANNAGCDTVAVRFLNVGDPWSSWKYYNPKAVNVSSNITLGPMVIDLNEDHTANAYIQNGWAFVYIEGKSDTAVGLNDIIANGLPIPANPGRCYTWGAIQDVNTSEIKPCRFLIDAYGILQFSYLGNCDNTHDVISLVAVYPVA